ncbi:MFS transporter [Cellulomonas phragmiteti]|uniref:Major facilitator superfamily (MFS) profile domain-containing protein n=1 Tax=Cellulomonas phragmiteti TaxID=478780 RepID=A0ABQ4DNP2_9CELL|nr:MFS transporter [Cellulomonas phragmiteti]GIG40976.1 hypothetical protein Cph01nite_27380 [Cellulomonas phragmiteti]
MSEPRTGVVAALRQAPSALYVLGAATFVSRSGGFLAIFGSIYLTSLSITPAQVVAVLTAVGVAGMLGSLASGRLADRFSARSVLVVVSATNAVVLVVLATSSDVTTALVSMVLAASLTQSFVPPAAAVVGNLAPDASTRTPFFAFFRLFLNVGATASPLIAVVLGETQFSRLFWYSAAANLVVAVLLATTLRVPPVDVVVPAGGTGAPEAASAALRSESRARWVRAVLLFAVLGVVAGIYAQYQSTLPLRIRDEHEALTLYSTLIVLNSVLVIVGELPVSTLTRRFPLRWPLAGGVLAMTVGLAASGLLAGWPVWLVVAGLLFTFGEMVFAPVTNTAAAAMAPPGRAGTYQGYLSSAQALGFALGPAAGVALYFGLGVGAWGVLLAVGVGCAVLLTVVLRPRADARDEPVPAPLTATGSER